MKLKTILGTVAMAAFFASSAMAASSSKAADPGTCIAADDHHGRCTIASSNCAQGYLPNPGQPPGCNCVCQHAGPAKQSKAPAKSEKPAKPKP